MQFSSRATKKRGDGAGRSVWQCHHLLQRHRGLHLHVCREYAAPGTQWSNDSATHHLCPYGWIHPAGFEVSILIWTIHYHRSDESSFSTLFWKVHTSIRSLPTMCLIVPTVCVPTHGLKPKIVLLLRWKSALTQGWVTLWHHIYPSHLNTKGRLMEQICLCDFTSKTEGLRLLLWQWQFDTHRWSEWHLMFSCHYEFTMNRTALHFFLHFLSHGSVLCHSSLFTFKVEHKKSWLKPAGF